MSHSALIKFAPVLTAERWSNPRWTRPDRTFYWNGALKLIPCQKTPVVIDHDMERIVGVVHELFTMEWTDGPWICARATLDDPPGWLKTYETTASFARWDVHSTPHDDGWDRVTRAFVKEVSLLSPAVEPAEPLACVTLFKPIEERAARIARAPASDGTVIHGNGQLLRRPNIGQVLGVR